MDSLDLISTYANSVAAIAAGNVATTTGTDNPALGPEEGDDHLQASGSFDTYLVYKPDVPSNNWGKSIWVVLGRFNWSFAFSAFLQTSANNTVMPTWVVTTTAPSTTAANPTGSDTHEFPEWLMRAQEAVPVKTP